MYFGMYDSAREMKKAREANIAFHARRSTRAIRAAARIVDPNSGFRLNVDPVLAAKIKAAGERMKQQAAENAALIAQRNKISARDRRLAEREAGATSRPALRRV